jgi:hypothetical protein
VAISEERRHEMYRKFEEVLGAVVASTVMEHLPPVGWADVATKHDLAARGDLFRRDLDAQSAAIRAEMAAGFASVRSELREGLAQVRLELRGDINRFMLWLFPTMLTAIGLAAGVAFGAAQLT